MTTERTLEELQDLVGQQLGISDWLTVDQPMIDAFAQVSGDHQFIHVDPERARSETPFGGTIAHGFLTLSLISRLCAQFAVPLQGTVMAINYGFDQVRFVSPVKAGSRIRARSELIDVNVRRRGQVLTRSRITVECDGVTKAALIADWLIMTVVDSKA